MTVTELLAAIQAAYPGATSEALRTFVPVFHKRLAHREGDKLQEAADEVFAVFRPKFGAPFPIPADFEKHLPSIAASKPTGSDGPPIREWLEARTNRSSALYADWVATQGRKIKEARHMSVYGACALAVMRMCRKANERTRHVVLTAEQIGICEMRALTSERAHRYQPCKTEEEWHYQLAEIRAGWAKEMQNQEAA